MQVIESSESRGLREIVHLPEVRVSVAQPFPRSPTHSTCIPLSKLFPRPGARQSAAMTTTMDYPDPYPGITHADLSIEQMMEIGVEDLVKIMNENIRRAQEQTTSVATGSKRTLEMMLHETPQLEQLPQFLELKAAVDKLSWETEDFYKKLIKMCLAAKMDVGHTLDTVQIEDDAGASSKGQSRDDAAQGVKRKRRTKAQMQELRAKGLAPPIRRPNSETSTSAPEELLPIPASQDGSEVLQQPAFNEADMESAAVSSTAESDVDSDVPVLENGLNAPGEAIDEHANSPDKSTTEPLIQPVSNDESDTTKSVDIRKDGESDTESESSENPDNFDAIEPLDSTQDLTARETEQVVENVPESGIASKSNLSPTQNEGIQSVARRMSSPSSSSSSSTENEQVKPDAINDNVSLSNAAATTEEAFVQSSGATNPTYAHVDASNDLEQEKLAFDGHSASTGNVPITSQGTTDIYDDSKVHAISSSTPLAGHSYAKFNDLVSSQVEPFGFVSSFENDKTQIPNSSQSVANGLDENVLKSSEKGNIEELGESSQRPGQLSSPSKKHRGSPTKESNVNLLLQSTKSPEQSFDLTQDTATADSLTRSFETSEEKARRRADRSARQQRKLEAKKKLMSASAAKLERARARKQASRMSESDLHGTPTPETSFPGAAAQENLVPRPSPWGPSLTQASPTPTGRITRSRSPVKAPLLVSSQQRQNSIPTTSDGLVEIRRSPRKKD